MTLTARALTTARVGLPLFRNLSFEVTPGSALHVRGGNGSGKTTLLRTLCGLRRPDSGQVLWNGADIHQAWEACAASLLYLGHASGLKDELLPAENLLFLERLQNGAGTQQDVVNALRSLGLERVLRQPVRMLSEGERKRVALARLALGAGKPLWILDEPFSALDRDAAALVVRLIEQHIARGGMLVYTTHQDVPLAGDHVREIRLEGVPC
jgi:heme exporter protein A